MAVSGSARRMGRFGRSPDERAKVHLFRRSRQFRRAVNRSAALGPSNGAAVGQTVPVGYTILDITLSPDHRYGVTVPDLNTPNPQNSLVEVETGRVLTVIQANTGYESANYNSVLPSRWAQDDSLLLWEVDSKWCDTALVLLKLENGTVVWQ